MPTSDLVLAIDQGTTNTKVILVDAGGSIIAHASRPMAIEYPQPGWVEQDAGAMWASAAECIDEVLGEAGADDLAAIGISNQRESGLAWDASTGLSVGPVVSWQCRRSAALCDVLRDAGHAEDIEARTGLPLDPAPAGPCRHQCRAQSDAKILYAARDVYWCDELPRD